MSDLDQLALDAMRADNIIDLETRQQYEALNDAAMGDWMSTEDRGPAHYFGGEAHCRWCGVYGPEGGENQPCVGATPTSEPQKLLNELQGIVTASYWDNLDTARYGRALDILHELSELFLNQK